MKKYYIRRQGYVGNALIWWKANSNGYTVDIREAGKYTEEEAKETCKRKTIQTYQ
ncbi:hypothetical protein [Riemerella anatipestifer]|uniref:hypothetical protein n=1 Tax=Riemerella anatipestifer TaxID=34085 RepID=UPI0021D5CF55|nr:hypothetical protein [Riemerella anatipestifer]MCU7542970.1 hypothetical protein [Riemerella anatipestifer]MCW0513671.1 hypothetical protein [Riemerella anatipestifer]